jgi:hypothetical protein
MRTVFVALALLKNTHQYFNIKKKTRNTTILARKMAYGTTM